MAGSDAGNAAKLEDDLIGNCIDSTGLIFFCHNADALWIHGRVAD